MGVCNIKLVRTYCTVNLDQVEACLGGTLDESAPVSTALTGSGL